MSFFQLVVEAYKLEKARVIYHNEKLHSIEMSKGIKPHYTISQKIRMKKIMLKHKILNLIQKSTCWHEDSWFYRTIILLKTPGTFENFLLKSFIGFMSGIFLTYMLFIFLIFHLKITFFYATLFSSLLGVIMTIGLAFSYRIRCIIFLLLPQFFSKGGRRALIAYALILTLTGPTKNTLHNVEVLSESLTCGQDEVKGTITNVIDLIKQPFYALRDSISKVIKSMKEVVKKIEKTLLSIKRIVLSILRVIKFVFEWLESIVSICNKKIGTPFERCERVFEGAVADCHAKLGPFFGGLCNLTYLVGATCYLVKPLDFICILVSFVSDAIVNAVHKKIRKFSNHMKVMFYVKVNFTHSFHFETNKSKNYGSVAIDIAKEIKSRTDSIQSIFDWMSLVTSFFILFMLLRVLRYHSKWLTSDRYDNKYITNYFRHIDFIRTKKDKETILPLNRRERKKYIPLTSITLITVEKIKLLKSAIFLTLATFKLCIHMAIDYSLFWVLSTISYYGRIQTKVQKVNSVGIHISGTGYLAELYRSIVRSFSPDKLNNKVDALPCLPDPLPPDYDRYTQIALIIIFCWIMAIFEPYGLRLRQVVMTRYYPDRAKQRSVYLYNQIIRSRGSFLKYARRQLRRKYGTTEEQNIEHVTWKERLFAICPILNICFQQKNKTCLLCGSVEREGQSQHIKCPNPSCVGLFCVECFADLQNICTICKTPMEYGDLSDISEEKDSSDDDFPKELVEKHRKKMGPTEQELNDIKIERNNQKLKNNNNKNIIIQILDESLRGGADINRNDYNYEMKKHSSLCTFSSPIARAMSHLPNKMAKKKIIYTKINDYVESTDSYENKKQNLLVSNRILKTCKLSHDDKSTKIYKNKFINSRQEFITTSTSTDYSSNSETKNMNNYHSHRDVFTSISDDLESNERIKKICTNANTQFLYPSMKYSNIKDCNHVQRYPEINYTSSESLKTSSIDDDSKLNLIDEFSNKSSSTSKVSKISNLSISTDSESSSERQRREEIVRWYNMENKKK